MCGAVARADALLQRDADDQATSTGLRAHALGIGYNVALGRALGLGFGHWKGAAVIGGGGQWMTRSYGIVLIAASP